MTLVLGSLADYNLASHVVLATGRKQVHGPHVSALENYGYKLMYSEF